MTFDEWNDKKKSWALFSFTSLGLLIFRLLISFLFLFILKQFDVKMCWTNFTSIQMNLTNKHHTHAMTSKLIWKCCCYQFRKKKKEENKMLKFIKSPVFFVSFGFLSTSALTKTIFYFYYIDIFSFSVDRLIVSVDIRRVLKHRQS